MIGRTPEYLGKKIEGKEMKLVAIVLIVHPLLILGFSALAVIDVYKRQGRHRVASDPQKGKASFFCD